MQSYGWNLQRLQHSRNKIASDQPYSSCNGNQCSFVFITLQAIIIFKTLKSSTSAYLADLLQLTISSTRSASHHRLQVNHSRTSFGCWAFSHFFVTVWNSLPSEIMSHSDSIKLSIFICHLKTHLFNKHFNLESSVIGQCLQLDLSTYDTIRTVYYYCYYYHNFSDTPDSK